MTGVVPAGAAERAAANFAQLAAFKDEGERRRDLPVRDTPDAIAPAEAMIAAVTSTAVTVERRGGSPCLEAAWQHVDEFTRDQWRLSIDSLLRTLQDLAAVTDSTPTIRRIK